MTSDGAGQSYAYDAENRLVSASGTKAATLAYDPLGRLFEVSGGGASTRFLYDGDELVGEYAAAGTQLRRYFFGPGTDEPVLTDEGALMNCGGTRVLHTDRQGSVVATADCWGNRAAINAYDEYGVPASGNAAILAGGRFGYTGQIWLPELGLWHYKARLYDPWKGRFLQVDPIGYDDQVNLYAYVGNDPMNASDPSGMACNSTLTHCSADTFVPGTSRARGTFNQTQADKVYAERSKFQKPVQGLEPQGRVTKSGELEIVKPISGQTRSWQESGGDSVKVKVGNGDFVHGHTGGTIVDDRAENQGYGDTESLEYGRSNFAVDGDRVGVHHASPDGQLEMTMTHGAMTPEEAAKMQENLDKQQMKFQRPKPE